MILGGIGIGILAGTFPCIGMIISSMALMHLKINRLVESGFQNFAAGLILAAVAAELFPLMAETTGVQGAIGISIGFVVGLLVVYGTEQIVDKCAGSSSDLGSDTSSNYGIRNSEQAEWEYLPLKLALEAISNEDHKLHILSHLNEMASKVDHISSKSNEILAADCSYKEESLASEEIDEAIHQLHYQLDHCHRLLQGTETENEELLTISARWPIEKKLTTHTKLLELKKGILQVIELMQSEKLTESALEDIHGHIDDLAVLIHNFHEVVEKGPLKWTARRHLFIPKQGTPLPLNLIVPVIVDGFVDGFLIGVSYSLNPKAGIILAAANTLEMSFLGITLALSVSKCTGSSVLLRRLAILTPPLIMFFATILGILIGNAALDNPILYCTFVSFGVVCLLALVCKELLIEAREAQGKEDRWYISIFIFVGIFIVLMLNRFLE